MKSAGTQKSPEPRGILKSDGELKEADRAKGILKQISSFETKQQSDPEKSALKRDSSIERPEIKSILKDPSFELEETTEKTDIKTEESSQEVDVSLETVAMANRSVFRQSAVATETRTTTVAKEKEESSSTTEEDTPVRRIKNEAIARRRARESRRTGQSESR